ncbi:CRISPR-associated endoribonuclease Cas6 [Domibacillus indicus]|uniref:CRISPR-associated endoribonuclease Cas6 n=1 Tax=Domibacillus indicus TaxID=1437523 RepID=UPI0006180AEE|nr:CRISPR-associated endoribonuclease Cas6 [Domibacillus indicus]
MRLKINIKAKEIPVAYRFGFLSMIKEAVTASDPHYAKQLFDSQNREMKPFAYSTYLKNFRFEGDSIKVDSFTITISSSDLMFMTMLYNGLVHIRKYRYKTYEWERGRIEMLPEKNIQSSSVLFRTLSPLLIESADQQPLAPHDPGYEQEFNYYANLTVQRMLKRSLKKPLIVRPMQMKKVVIKENTHHINGGNQVLYLTAYKGMIFVEGDPADLDCLYKNGCSKRRSAGFGLLDIEMEGMRT